MPELYIPTQEIVIPAGQVDHAAGQLALAAQSAFDYNDGEVLYRPDVSLVPRPNFDQFIVDYEAFAEQNQINTPDRHNGRVTVNPAISSVLLGHAGLRGRVRTVVPGPDDKPVVLTGPAIVLQGGRSFAILTAEKAGPVSTMHHALLEGEYSKDTTKVTPNHTDQDITNSGEIAPALIVVSNDIAKPAHGSLHDFARERSSNQTFGTAFSNSGRQDIVSTSGIRRIRSVVVPTINALFYAGDQDQLPEGVSLFTDSGLSPAEVIVGMTLAAQSTQGKRPDLQTNLRAMNNDDAV